jgi:hypothetical protein
MTDYRTETEKIDTEIQSLHNKIGILAANQKYDSMNIYIAEISKLEDRKRKVNKVEELTVIHNHVENYHTCPEDDCFRSWGSDYHDGDRAQHINKRLFNALISAVKQLDTKVSIMNECLSINKYIMQPNKTLLDYKKWIHIGREGNIYHLTPGITVCYSPATESNDPLPGGITKIVGPCGTIRADNAAFGRDPAPGLVKQLWIVLDVLSQL